MTTQALSLHSIVVSVLGQLDIEALGRPQLCQDVPHLAGSSLSGDSTGMDCFFLKWVPWGRYEVWGPSGKGLSVTEDRATFQPGDATVGPFSFPSACPANAKCSFSVLVNCLGPSWLVELGSANPSEWLAKAHFTLPRSTLCISFWSPQKETTCIKQ